MSVKPAPKRKAAPEGMDWSGNQSDDSNEHRFHGRTRAGTPFPVQLTRDAAPRDASVRSHRVRRGLHYGLMYWNSDRFCICTKAFCAPVSAF